MRFGLDIAQQRMPWPELASRVRFADELGFDGIWGFDHFQPMYGEGPGECFEGNTTLAAWSGITERVRLGLLVTGMTYRHPSVFAAEAITIDHASDGRLELSYGAAWFDEEHRRLGIPFPPLKERIDAFEEAVQIVRGLLTTDGFTFEGEHFQVRATLHPPAGAAAAPADLDRRVGREAHDADRGALRRRLALLRPGRGARREVAAAQRHGGRGGSGAERDPARRVALARGRPRRRRTVERWDAAGFEYLVCGWPSQGRSRVEEFAARSFRLTGYPATGGPAQIRVRPPSTGSTWPVM